MDTVQILGVSLETSAEFLLAALAFVQGYNLLAFTVYARQSLTHAKASDLKNSMTTTGNATEGLDGALVKRAWANKFLGGPWEIWIPPVAGVVGLVLTVVVWIRID